MYTPHDSATAASTTGGLPVAPSLGPAIEQLDLPHANEENRARIVYISLLAIGAAIAAPFAAEVLVGVIAVPVLGGIAATCWRPTRTGSTRPCRPKRPSSTSVPPGAEASRVRH